MFFYVSIFLFSFLFLFPFSGGEVELFGWDETRQWRQCADHRAQVTTSPALGTNPGPNS